MLKAYPAWLVGEGEYERAEQIIQQLLAEAGNGSVPQGLISIAACGAEEAPDWIDMKSPETYVGYDEIERTENFASRGGALESWSD